MDSDDALAICQKEIRRLRSVVREYEAIRKRFKAIDYDCLFGLWCKYHDSEASDKVLRLIEENKLGIMDSLSFISFCSGYEKAAQAILEEL